MVIFICGKVLSFKKGEKKGNRSFAWLRMFLLIALDPETSSG